MILIHNQRYRGWKRPLKFVYPRVWDQSLFFVLLAYNECSVLLLTQKNTFKLEKRGRRKYVCILDHKNQSSVFRSMSILFIVYRIWIVYCLGFCLVNSNYAFFACSGGGESAASPLFLFTRILLLLLLLLFVYYFFYNKGIKSGFCCPKNINFSLKNVADQKLNPEKLLRRVWT